MRKSIHEQIESAKRELGMRQRVYPNWVKSGRLTQARADHEIDAMTAIIATLETTRDLDKFRAAEDARLGADHGGILVTRPLLKRLQDACAFERP